MCYPKLWSNTVNAKNNYFLTKLTWWVSLLIITATFDWVMWIDEYNDNGGGRIYAWVLPGEDGWRTLSQRLFVLLYYDVTCSIWVLIRKNKSPLGEAGREERKRNSPIISERLIDLSPILHYCSFWREHLKVLFIFLQYQNDERTWLTVLCNFILLQYIILTQLQGPRI
jgi:hypothetical protein